MKSALHFLPAARTIFQNYKSTAEKAIAQLPEGGIHWHYSTEDNSIAITIQHLWGNMRSRWIDFMNSDGEKPWRERDAEFEAQDLSQEELMILWEAGWQTLFHALEGLSEDDLERIVYIRDEPYSVVEAISRQLAHYGYHVGQIVQVAKMLSGDKWESLSIPKKRA